MPAGTCDPASRGQVFNSGEMQIGPILVEYRYGWDGESTRETGCVGPLQRIRVTNQSPIGVWPAQTWYVHLKGRRGQPKVFELPAGFTDTFNAAALATRGLLDNTDLEDLNITDSPIPPTR